MNEYLPSPDLPKHPIELPDYCGALRLVPEYAPLFQVWAQEVQNWMKVANGWTWEGGRLTPPQLGSARQLVRCKTIGEIMDGFDQHATTLMLEPIKKLEKFDEPLGALYRPIGHITSTNRDEYRYGDERGVAVELSSLVVDPSTHKKGVGTKLIQTMGAHVVQQSNGSDAVLYAITTNPASTKAFSNADYVPLEMLLEKCPEHDIVVGVIEKQTTKDGTPRWNDIVRNGKQVMVYAGPQSTSLDLAS